MAETKPRRGRRRTYFPTTTISYNWCPAGMCRVHTEDRNLTADLWDRILPRYGKGQPSETDPKPAAVSFCYAKTSQYDSNNPYSWPVVLPWKQKANVSMTVRQREKWHCDPTIEQSFMLPTAFLPDLRAIVLNKENHLNEPPVVPTAVPVPFPDVYEGDLDPGPGIMAAINQHPRGLIEYQTGTEWLLINHWLAAAFTNAEVLFLTNSRPYNATVLVSFLNESKLDYRQVGFNDIPEGAERPPLPPHPRCVVAVGSSFVDRTIRFGKSLLVVTDCVNAWNADRSLTPGLNRTYGLVRNFASLKTEEATRLLGAYGDIIFSTTDFKAHSSAAAPSVA